MAIPIYQVDAFAERPFAGNPACVCLMDVERPDDWLQSVATEMNLSETAFVWPRSGRFQLRWFTPAAEVQLCGHATMATAHVLWTTGRLPPNEQATFDTLSGELITNQSGDQIIMDFPVNNPVKSEVPAGLSDGLGTGDFEYVGSDGTDYLVQLNSESGVRSLQPDFRSLAGVKARGIIVTAVSGDPEFDFVSRFFAPAVGVDEDPVTGSAHTVLTPFWANELGKTDLRALQVSKRAGVVSASVQGDRVLLGGKAVTVWHGDLIV